MAELILPSGHVALVDDADLPAVLAAGPWHALLDYRMRYPIRYAARHPSRNRTQRLHQFLTGHPLTDHINGNGLDNRRANLRPATKRQNGQNAKARVGTSRFKGVSWFSRDSCWRVQIVVDAGSMYVGRFDDEIAAAHAYDAAARNHHGPFARLNFPMPGEQGALL